jgi:hypothetical protein
MCVVQPRDRNGRVARVATREQGLSKAGNRLRHIMIELAWL